MVVRYGLMSHSTHLGPFRVQRCDGGISQDCSRSQCWGYLHSATPQCVQRPLITVACMCVIWKALCPYILDAVEDCGFLWTKLSDHQAQPNSWLTGSMRGLQPGGHVHKYWAAHLLSLQPASITSSCAF